MRGTHTSTNEEDTTHSVTRISSSSVCTLQHAHCITLHIKFKKTASMAICTLVHRHLVLCVPVCMDLGIRTGLRTASTVVCQ